MTDDATLTDAELAERVAAYDPELAKQIRARLRVLRLARIVTAEPPPVRDPASPQLAGLANPAHGGHPRQM